MQTPSNIMIWLSEQATPLIAIALFLGLVMTVLTLSARRRRAHMNEVRSGTNEDTFVDSLIIYGFDPEISRTVYRYLQERQNVHFPIDANDRLDEDLGLDLVDLEQTQEEVFEMVRRVYQPGLRHTPLVTVEDLVRFIQASPRISERAA